MKDLVTPPTPPDLGAGLSVLDDIVVPDDVLMWPSMMTKDEVSLVYRLAAAHYSGRGEIVDAGIFLGASTHAFARGLEAGDCCA